MYSANWRFFPLSQADSPVIGQNQGQIIYVCLVLVVLLMVGMAAIAWLRRWSRRNDDSPGGGFTTDSIRQLYKAGKLSEEEYKKLGGKVKQAMRDQFMAQANKNAPPAGNGAAGAGGGHEKPTPPAKPRDFPKRQDKPKP